MGLKLLIHMLVPISFIIVLNALRSNSMISLPSALILFKFVSIQIKSDAIIFGIFIPLWHFAYHDWDLD